MNFLALLLIGIVAGTLGGMLGLGGSVILIPALNEVFGVQQHLYQSAAMVLNLFVALTASWGHRRAGAILSAVVRVTIPAAVLSVVVGVQVSELTFFQGARQTYLTGVFGFFMLAAAACTAVRMFRGPSDRSTLRDPISRISGWKSALAVRLPSGFISGLLGVGGGLIAVPAQQIFLGLPLRTAIANSAVTMCALSVVGATTKNYHWWAAHPQDPFAPLVIAAFLLPVAVAGGFLGSRLTHKLPSRWLAGTLLAMMIFGGVRQISHAWL